MASRFITDSATMDRAVKQVNDVDAEIQSSLSSLRAEVATAPAHFKGNAAQTFTQLMATYDQNALKLRQALRGIAEQLSASSKSYAAQDQVNSDALRSSGSGLNMG